MVRAKRFLHLFGAEDVAHSEYPGRDGAGKKGQCGVMEEVTKLVSNVNSLRHV